MQEERRSYIRPEEPFTPSNVRPDPPRASPKLTVNISHSLLLWRINFSVAHQKATPNSYCKKTKENSVKQFWKGLGSMEEQHSCQRMPQIRHDTKSRKRDWTTNEIPFPCPALRRRKLQKLGATGPAAAAALSTSRIMRTES